LSLLLNVFPLRFTREGTVIEMKKRLLIKRGKDKQAIIPSVLSLHISIVPFAESLDISSSSPYDTSDNILFLLATPTTSSSSAFTPSLRCHHKQSFCQTLSQVIFKISFLPYSTSSLFNISFCADISSLSTVIEDLNIIGRESVKMGSEYRGGPSDESSSSSTFVQHLPVPKVCAILLLFLKRYINLNIYIWILIIN
jgi:hypothetical protein